MRGGIRFGRLFGIDLLVDLGWPAAFLFVSVNLVFVFSAWHPAWPLAVRVGLALLASLLFFASILAHELTHALAARLFGTRTRSIRLLFFGGVADIEREPPSPVAEFIIAFAGPLASLALGAALSFGALVSADPAAVEGDAFVAALGPAATLAAWLGVSNVAVGLFNLLPGFPLDGGRMLRASLWALSGSLARATQWASWVGQLVALALIGAGLAMAFGSDVPLLGTGVASGLWLVLVGGFIYSAASQASRRCTVRDALEGVPVARLLRAPARSVRPQLDLRSLVEGWQAEGGSRPMPVVEGASLLGLVRPDDVRPVDPASWADTPLRTVMKPLDRLPTASSHDDLDGALAKLVEGELEEMPVLEGGRFVGLLHLSDITRYLELEAPARRRRPRRARAVEAAASALARLP
ncbi:MAG TPA: site-2 protease family protein [Polyangiaceae bacterium]|nr:site-2 protease family protein [Polyangiaceae bacterium]